MIEVRLSALVTVSLPYRVIWRERKQDHLKAGRLNPAETLNQTQWDVSTPSDLGLIKDFIVKVVEDSSSQMKVQLEILKKEILVL